MLYPCAVTNVCQDCCGGERAHKMLRLIRCVFPRGDNASAVRSKIKDLGKVVGATDYQVPAAVVPASFSHVIELRGARGGFQEDIRYHGRKKYTVRPPVPADSTNPLPSHEIEVQSS